MPGLKRLKKRKVYNFGRNRKRERKQQEKTSKFNVKVDCKAMKDVWDNRVTMKENMAAMGVALDANEVMPFAGTKKKLVNKLKRQNQVPIEEKSSVKVTKPEVVTQLEDEANVEAKPTFRFTPTQVQLITYMMDKHKMDFKAMARDPKNHYQETPAKLKGMVTKFISIPEHYAPYCKERGLITPSEKKPEPSLDEVESPTSCDMVDEGGEDEVMEDEDNEDADLAPDSSGSESDGDNED